MLEVVLAKSFSKAKDFLDKPENRKKEWVALETEYGEQTLDERHPSVKVALNHHGIFQDNSAPALAYTKNLKKRYDHFIVSHIDLDSLFGILWTAGWLKRTDITKGLSTLVALSDINGFHTIKPFLDIVPEDIQHRYYAIGYLVNSWVIKDNGELLVNISKEIHKLLLRIKDIIIKGATPEQIELYKNWFKEQEKVKKKYIQDVLDLCNDDKLFVYRAPFGLTTAYDIGNIHAKIIVQYHEQSKSISISCFDETVVDKYFGEIGVIEPLTKFFGKEAGGKKTIGGTPRSLDVQPEMLQAFLEFLFREYFNPPEVIDLTDAVSVDNLTTVTIKDREYLLPFKKMLPDIIKKALV